MTAQREPTGDIWSRLLLLADRVAEHADEIRQRIAARAGQDTPQADDQQRAEFEYAAQALESAEDALRRADPIATGPAPTDVERALDALQELFKDVPPGVSLADELIAERREAARREAEE
jgi:hypothetical protein